MRKMKERIQAKRAHSALDRRLRRAWWWRVDAPGGGHFLQRGPLPQLTQVKLLRRIGQKLPFEQTPRHFVP